MGDTSHARPIVVRKVGLIGDVHTERASLTAALAALSDQGVDRVLCTGDVADGPGDTSDVEACCTLLRQAGVVTVCGNHDRWLLDGEMRDLADATRSDEVSPDVVAFLRALPASVELETPAGLALLCHGLGADDMAQVSPFDHGRALEDNAPLQELLAAGRYRYLLNGHSHKPMVRTLGGLTVINAGTLLRDHAPCCAAIDFERRTVTYWTLGPEGTKAVSHQLSLDQQD